MKRDRLIEIANIRIERCKEAMARTEARMEAEPNDYWRRIMRTNLVDSKKHIAAVSAALEAVLNDGGGDSENELLMTLA